MVDRVAPSSVRGDGLMGGDRNKDRWRGSRARGDGEYAKAATTQSKYVSATWFPQLLIADSGELRSRGGRAD